MTHVRVGIVAWNCADVLDRCLEALPAAVGDLEAEVVVVDNGSSDASAQVAEDAGVQVVRAGQNLGYARGMNRALAGTDAPFLIALNPDTEPPPGSLEALVGELRDRPDVAVVAPLLRHTDGSIQHSVHRFPTLRLALVANLVPAGLLPAVVRDRLWLPGAVRPDRSGPVDWAIGAVHVLRASAVSDPPYGERWFMYVEDVDLCARVAEDGWRTWFAAGIEVRHAGGVSARRAFGDGVAGRWWAATYDWYRLRHGERSLRLYALLNLLGVLGRAIVGLGLPSRRSRARAAARLARHHARAVRWGPPGLPGPP